MTAKRGEIVVVDGSNLATEGRSAPSLRQLNDAVIAYMEEHPDAQITVVVDASFGHRIDPSEVADFDAGVANNELVTPPAGAIGRGDAFVLSIANKVGAQVLSNDSFQEFHGEYKWLFDGGRLIGGKPVPNVGWVFVERLPVRGAVSRKATQASAAKRTPRKASSRSETSVATERASRAKATAEGRLPPPPKAQRAAAAAAPATDPAPTPAARGQNVPEAVNDLIGFIEFVEHHPVGTSVNAVVESYSSHGAYVTMDQVRGYVPLQLISDPPPRSARSAMAVGDAVTLVVASFSPARRSIDLAFPAMAAKLAIAEPPVKDAAGSGKAPTSKKAATKRPASKKAAAAAAKAPASKKAPAKKATSAATSRAPAKSTRKAAAKSSPTDAPAATRAPAAKKAAKQRPAAKKSAAKQPVARTATTETAAATEGGEAEHKRPSRRRRSGGSEAPS